MCPLYMFLDDPSPFSRYPLCSPLWLLLVCSLFQCLWLYFACLVVLLIRFNYPILVGVVGEIPDHGNVDSAVIQKTLGIKSEEFSEGAVISLNE